MVSALISRCLLLILGTLYPAYRSYKAIKNKDVREHVKWMMYWIVFALFTTLETFLDIFFSWFPFYYEIKILFILWVLSPATRGSSLLYKKLVHPMLQSREKEIDELIEKTKQQGYTTFLHLFSSGFEYASALFVSSAVKGQLLLGSQLKKSLSMNDVNGMQEMMADSAASAHNLNSNKKKPETINEDSSDFENDSVEELRKQSSSTRKPSISSRDFEIIDDEHNMWMPEELDSAKKQATANGMSGTRRKQSATNFSSASARHLPSNASFTNTDNYKSNEMSHFGTITRAKSGSRTRNNNNFESDYYR